VAEVIVCGTRKGRARSPELRLLADTRRVLAHGAFARTAHEPSLTLLLDGDVIAALAALG